jgi:hypothetical protein
MDGITLTSFTKTTTTTNQTTIHDVAVNHNNTILSSYLQRRRSDLEELSKRERTPSTLPLPTHVMGKHVIAKFLTMSDIINTMLCCHQFQEWCIDGITCMKRFDFPAQKGSIFGWLKRMQHIEHLSLVTTNTNLLVECSRRVGLRLKTLKLKYCDDRSLQDIALECHNVQFLTIGDDAKELEFVSDVGIGFIARGCPQLHEITIKGAKSTSETTIITLLKCCLEIKRIIMHRCGVTTNLSNIPAAVVAMLPTSVVAPAAPPTNDGEIIQQPQDLDINTLMIHMIHTIQSGNKSLIELDVSQNVDVSDMFLTMIPLEQLQILKISGAMWITEEGLKLISMTCKSLSVLSVANCPGVTDEGLRYLGNINHNFRSIDCFRCRHATDYGLIPLLSGANQLESLNIASCFRASDEILRELAKNCPKLKSVNFEGLAQITDSGMEILSRSCTQLLEVTLKLCSSLSNVTLTALSDNCHELRSLDLFCVNKINDKGLEMLSRGCRKLKRLNVSYCYLLTSDILRDCTDELWPHLIELVAEGRDDIVGTIINKSSPRYGPTTTSSSFFTSPGGGPVSNSSGGNNNNNGVMRGRANSYSSIMSESSLVTSSSSPRLDSMNNNTGTILPKGSSPRLNSKRTQQQQQQQQQQQHNGGGVGGNYIDSNHHVLNQKKSPPLVGTLGVSQFIVGSPNQIVGLIDPIGVVGIRDHHIDTIQQHSVSEITTTTLPLSLDREMSNLVLNGNESITIMENQQSPKRRGSSLHSFGSSNENKSTSVMISSRSPRKQQQHHHHVNFSSPSSSSNSHPPLTFIEESMEEEFGESLASSSLLHYQTPSPPSISATSTTTTTTKPFSPPRVFGDHISDLDKMKAFE